MLLWIHQHRVAGFVIFCLLYIWFTVLFLPPALLAACAGAIYGFLVAIPLVWLCAVLGETVSFLLGRFLLKSWVKELTADWPMWTALDGEWQQSSRPALAEAATGGPIATSQAVDGTALLVPHHAVLPTCLFHPTQRASL